MYNTLSTFAVYKLKLITNCDMSCSVFNAGGLLFVQPLREKKCVTILDPFNEKYGKVLTAVMSLVSLFLDVVWVPGTLIGLGELYQ